MDDVERAVWDRAPHFVSIEVKTWEHAIAEPGSWGVAVDLRRSNRILPPEITDPFYAALARGLAAVRRISEPFPPLRARLLRSELPGELDPVLFERFEDVVPDWDARLKGALGPRYEDVARKIAERGFSAGLPSGGLSISYGYTLKVTEFPGPLVDPRADTHCSLVMGRHAPRLQPGFARDMMSALAGRRDSSR